MKKTLFPTSIALAMVMSLYACKKEDGNSAAGSNLPPNTTSVNGVRHTINSITRRISGLDHNLVGDMDTVHADGISVTFKYQFPSATGEYPIYSTGPSNSADYLGVYVLSNGQDYRAMNIKARKAIVTAFKDKITVDIPPIWLNHYPDNADSILFSANLVEK
jgi:hypothetical protein